MKIFTDNPDFYPTPNGVIEQMMLGEDFVGKTILEPSAGKGNIVDWLKENRAGRVIACENDPNIRKLLNGKCEVIADDFLTVTADMVSHIDYIVMNPPFSKGARHILHAWEIAPPGCIIVALCNSSNLDSCYRSDYQTLQETVKLYGNEEYLGEVFNHAERRTGVSVSLVKLYKGGEGENEWDGFFFSEVDEDTANLNDKEGIMHYNVVRDLVNRYVSAVKLFDETMQAAKRINETAEFFDYTTDEDGQQHMQTYGYLPIKFGAVKASNDHATEVTHDQYKKELQKYYWRIIFHKLNMEKYATQNLREQINKFIEMQKNVPFTMGNVYRVIDMVIQTTGQRMQKALQEAFDHICSFSAENSTAGEKWKTNSNYMVNKKFIVPWMCSTYEWDRQRAYLELNWGGSMDKLEDVNKALCYLTGTNYDEVQSLREAVRRQHPLWGEWFTWGFFRCKGFKKGTMHFEFLDEDVFFKFNYEVAKLRGWSLPKRTEKKRKAPQRKKKNDVSGQTSIFRELEVSV